uniref:Uncharacterized protein n=1 Tax=Anopheles atroparvus TaxID=41427 RepID=A0A182JJB4_ANOAO
MAYEAAKYSGLRMTHWSGVMKSSSPSPLLVPQSPTKLLKYDWSAKKRARESVHADQGLVAAIVVGVHLDGVLLVDLLGLAVDVDHRELVSVRDDIDVVVVLLVLSEDSLQVQLVSFAVTGQDGLANLGDAQEVTVGLGLEQLTLHRDVRSSLALLAVGQLPVHVSGLVQVQGIQEVQLRHVRVLVRGREAHLELLAREGDEAVEGARRDVRAEVEEGQEALLLIDWAVGVRSGEHKLGLLLLALEHDSEIEDIDVAVADTGSGVAHELLLATLASGVVDEGLGIVVLVVVSRESVATLRVLHVGGLEVLVVVGLLVLQHELHIPKGFELKGMGCHFRLKCDSSVRYPRGRYSLNVAYVGRSM